MKWIRKFLTNYLIKMSIHVSAFNWLSYHTFGGHSLMYDVHASILHNWHTLSLCFWEGVWLCWLFCCVYQLIQILSVSHGRRTISRSTWGESINKFSLLLCEHGHLSLSVWCIPVQVWSYVCSCSTGIIHTCRSHSTSSEAVPKRPVWLILGVSKCCFKEFITCHHVCFILQTPAVC